MNVDWFAAFSKTMAWRVGVEIAGDTPAATGGRVLNANRDSSLPV